MNVLQPEKHLQIEIRPYYTRPRDQTETDQTKNKTDQNRPAQSWRAKFKQHSRIKNNVTPTIQTFLNPFKHICSPEAGKTRTENSSKSWRA